MNKLFNKIAAGVVGLAMAVGVGVAIGSQSKAEARSVNAAETTVSMSTFSSVSGNIDGDTNVSYIAEKGDASTAPAVNSGEIRIYQNGGLLTITPNNGATLKSVTIGSSMATTVQVSVDSGSFSTNNSISANGTYTKGSISATSNVVFKCTGTSKTSRLYLNYLSVTYEISGSVTPTKGTLAITSSAGNSLNEGATGTFGYTLTGGTQSTLSTQNWTSSNSSVLEITNASTGAYSAKSAGSATVTLTGTDASEFSYTSGNGAATYAVTVIEDPFASFVKVTSAASLTATDVFALGYDKTYFAGNAVSNSNIAKQTTIENVGYFCLDGAGHLAFCTESDGVWTASSTYINNSSSTGLSTGAASSVWEANDDGEYGVILQNTSNSNRFLGFNNASAAAADQVRAYAVANLHAGDNNAPVYLYKVGSLPSQKYTVTYNANGATSGDVPVDSTEYDSGDTVTVLGNTGNLARTDFTFVGWNTLANGTGIDYVAENTFSILGNTTLYAKWSANPVDPYIDDTSAHTITWDLTKATYVTSSETELGWTSPKATMEIAKEDATTGANNYCPPAQTSTRFYANSVLTIAPVSGYKITSIVATATTEGYATAFASSTWTNATATADGTSVTIVPSVFTSEVSAVIGATCGFTSFVVHYASASDLSSIAVTGAMTRTDYYVGNQWNPEGLVVTATYQDSSTAVITSSVTWTYNPANANSTSVTSVKATASYTEGEITKTAFINQQVSVTVDTSPRSDEIVVGDTNAIDTAYVTTTGICKNIAVYTSNNAKASSEDGGGLQYRSNNNNSGIVSTVSGGLITSVVVNFTDGKTGQVDVYGRNTAYTSPSDLYSISTQGTLIGSVSNDGTVTVTSEFKYVGLRSSGGSRYLDGITFNWDYLDPTAPFISIDQPSSENEIGASGTLTATVENAGSNVVTWSSSDSSVVSINSSTGAWSANKVGSAAITATLGSTGKTSTIDLNVTGLVNVATARTFIDGLGGNDSSFAVTVTGFVVSSSGDGTSKKNNSIFIADSTEEGADQLQVYFGYKAISTWTSSTWSELTTAGTRIKAKGTLTKYNTSYEVKNIISIEIVDADRAAVEDFVLAYMHMNDYNSNQGYCNDGSHHYYLTAKQGLNDLTPTQLTLFREDAEFASAKARYEAWAVANNDGAPYDGNDEIVTTINNRIAIFGKIDDEQSGTAIAITVASILSVAALGGYFFLKKKKITK